MRAHKVQNFYSLIRATKHLRDEFTSYEGCPLIVRDDLVDPVPSSFLMHLWQESYSRDTISAYAFALIKWLRYLAFRRLEWWRANLDDVSKFRRTMEGRSAGSTINVALAAVARFHRWLRSEGLCSVPEFKVSPSRSQRKDSAQAVRGCRVLECDPRAITKAELDDTLAASTRKGSGICLRDEIAAELGFWTGLRRMEIAGLQLQQIEEAEDCGEIYRVKITHTKGRKPRKVDVPDFLMRRIRRYIRVYRADIIARRKSDKSYKDNGFVFLTIHGRPLRREYITQTWAEAATRVSSPSTFHWTRHSYGTRAANAVEAAGLSLRIVASRMGHADIRTTLRYVSSSHVAESDRWTKRLSEPSNAR